MKTATNTNKPSTRERVKEINGNEMNKLTTREQWLQAAGERIYEEIIKPQQPMKDGVEWVISVGWPSTRPLSEKNRRLGECWHAEASEDGKHQLFVTPYLSEPVAVLATIIHELVHVVVGPNNGHRTPFKQLALAVGLEGKMSATTPGSVLDAKLARLVDSLGPYPHSKLKGVKLEKVQTTRLIKCVAVKCCQYVVRTTRVWIDDEGLPKCPHGSRMEEELADE